MGRPGAGGLPADAKSGGGGSAQAMDESLFEGVRGKSDGKSGLIQVFALW